MIRAAALALVPSIALAAPCDALNARLESLLKESALTYAKGVGDHDATRAGLRESERLRQQLERNGLLMQVQAAGCKVPTEPSEPNPYKGAALECARPTNRPTLAGPECDLSNWRRR